MGVAWLLSVAAGPCHTLHPGSLGLSFKKPESLKGARESPWVVLLRPFRRQADPGAEMSTYSWSGLCCVLLPRPQTD